MYVLVDFNNISRSLGRRNGKFIVEAIAEKVCALTNEHPHRMRFRLYGGWYEETTPSRRAQELAAELEGEFPLLFRPAEIGTEKQKPVRLQASLAYAMLVDPQHHLLHTVREEKTYKSVRVNSPKTSGCQRDDCHLLGINALFSKGRCPHADCSLVAEDILSEKRQQKLVDTMLTADLLHLNGQDTAETVVLVSSDDDFVPAIRQSLLSGMRVIHVHTGPRSATPTHYLSSDLTDYLQTSLEEQL
jgi:uncharacterized LabA/DUF88 family protein